MMWNMPWVWPEVGDAGTSDAGAAPLRLAQMMGQQKKKKKKSFNNIYHVVSASKKILFFFFFSFFFSFYIKYSVCR